MMKSNSRFRWGGLVLTIAVVTFFSPDVEGVKKMLYGGPETRSDLITVDTLKIYGKLERPPVPFRHDQHTEALEKSGKDCLACHKKADNRLSPKFMRLQESGKEATMDIYHANCTGCHKELRSSGLKSAPVTCGACHLEQTTVISNRQPMGFDKSLHYRHADALDSKCESCHHAYNDQAQKLYYPKGEEGTCRYCHKAESEENRISMRLASHLSCIACHQDKLSKKKRAGPIHCNGCHDPIAQENIEKVDPVPRMKRNQPETVLVSVGLPKGISREKNITMNRVPFQHKAHEEYNDSCRVCHHAGLNACSECHTQTGDKKGDFVKLETAMHRLDSQQSCMGCHEAQQKKSECAACHTLMGKSRKQAPEECLKCHMDLPPVAAMPPNVEPEKVLAEEMLAARTPLKNTYAEADIPEKVTIRHLENKYEPVEMPHRMMAQSLMRKIRDNQLVQYFHDDPGTLCQGCHHNSPASRKPPICASCHGKPFDERKPLQPGLMGAYHQQCMGCHQVMGIEKASGCTDCHREK